MYPTSIYLGIYLQVSRLDDVARVIGYEASRDAGSLRVNFRGFA